MKRALALVAALLFAAPAFAQSPSATQAQVSAAVTAKLAVRPNTIAQVGDAITNGSAAPILSLIGGMGYWDTSGAFHAAIQSGDITTAKIAPGSITAALLAPGAIASGIGNAGGDVSGPYSALVVSRINGASPAAIAISGSAADLTTGIVSAARMPAFTGDCTSVIGTSALSCSGSQIVNTANTWALTQTFSVSPIMPTPAAADNSTKGASTAYADRAASNAAAGATAGYAPLASPAFTGVPTAPTAAVNDNTTKLATTAYSDRSSSNVASSVATTYAPIASPAFTGSPTAPTQTAADNSTKLATTAYTDRAVANSSGGGGGASLNSPAFTGTPTAPTQPANDNSTKIATTAYADRSSSNAVVGLAPTASPAFTGSPTAPTQAANDNTTKLASTAYADRSATNAASGVSSATAATYAPLASPALTGSPTAPTQALNDNTTKLATTAYADRIGSNAASTYAPLASPTFTGSPTAPTPAAADSTQKLATSAFVANAISQYGSTASATFAPLASPALTGSPTAPTAAAADNTTKLATTAYADRADATIASNAAATYAPLASPALTGSPTAPTAAAYDNTTKLATTAYSDRAASNATNGFAPLASPALTGTPTAPTATAGDNTAQIATDAFVSSAIAAIPAPTPANRSAVRQTVISGTYLANNSVIFPSSGTGKASISTSSAFTASAASGYGANGPIDINLAVTDTKTFTGPFSNSTTYYMYINTSTGVANWTTMTPIYTQYLSGVAGATRTAAGQFVFDVQAMIGYLGDGTSANKTPLVFLGECTYAATGGNYTCVTYSFNGAIETPFSTPLQGTASAVNFNHTLGVEGAVTTLSLTCLTAEGGYAVGDTVNQNILTAPSAGVYVPLSISNNRNVSSFITGASAAYALQNKSTGAIFTLTAANWNYKISVRRRF